MDPHQLRSVNVISFYKCVKGLKPPSEYVVRIVSVVVLMFVSWIIYKCRGLRMLRMSQRRRWDVECRCYLRALYIIPVTYLGKYAMSLVHTGWNYVLHNCKTAGSHDVSMCFTTK
jgi:hypothetical protein